MAIVFQLAIVNYWQILIWQFCTGSLYVYSVVVMADHQIAGYMVTRWEVIQHWYISLLRLSMMITSLLISLRIISSTALLEGVQIRIRGFVGFSVVVSGCPGRADLGRLDCDERFNS